jgi:hypothetical protein
MLGRLKEHVVQDNLKVIDKDVPSEYTLLLPLLTNDHGNFSSWRKTLGLRIKDGYLNVNVRGKHGNRVTELLDGRMMVLRTVLVASTAQD